MAALLRRISAWADHWLRQRLASSAVALGLCLVLVLGGCSGSANGLTGNYVDDTVNVAQRLLETISLAQEDPARPQAETDARALINDYVSRYRPRNDVNGLGSFTTMQTALNSLAGHYTNYPNRPLPDALKERIGKELKKAETNVVRGA